jgi:hypothetical protein
MQNDGKAAAKQSCLGADDHATPHRAARTHRATSGADSRDATGINCDTSVNYSLQVASFHLIA